MGESDTRSVATISALNDELVSNSGFSDETPDSYHETSSLIDRSASVDRFLPSKPPTPLPKNDPGGLEAKIALAADLLLANRPAEVLQTYQREKGEYHNLLQRWQEYDTNVQSKQEAYTEYAVADGRSPSMAARRWQQAFTLVAEAQRLQRHARVLADPSAKPSDRLVAAVELSMQQGMWARLLAQNPHKRLLQQYVAKKRRGAFKSLWDRLDTELYLTGALLFNWFTPARMNRHWLVFTWVFPIMVWSVFFFMAAQYPYYHAYRTYADCTAAASSAANATSSALPCADLWLTPLTDYNYMLAWLYQSGPAYEFSFEFMRRWGGRYNPDVAQGDASRWFTGQFIHSGFQHILSNTLLFVVMSTLLEAKYGAARITLVWMASMLGANFLSAALENPCVQVVGASGGIFGLFGMFVADMVMNFDSVKRPILRSLLVLAFLSYFVYTAFTQVHISNVSHMGGLVCGLFPGFLFLPNLSNERWEALLPLLGLLVLLAVYVVLPIWIYGVVFADLLQKCGISV